MPAPLRPAALLFVFVAMFALVASAALFADRKRLAAARAVRERLAAPLPGVAEAGGAVRLVRGAERLSGFAFLERALGGWRGTARVAELLRRAGVERTVGEFVLAGARSAAYEAQLPEALDAIVNSLKAGYSFPAALEFASGEVPAPLGAELARVRDEQRLGVEARPALVGFAERVGTTDARMFVTAVLVQRETGGNLAELLTDLSGLVRDRAAFRGRVAALTAEPRMSAIVLALLPVFLFAVMYFINRSYMEPMLHHPIGRLALVGAAVLTTGGYLAMRKLGDVAL